MRKISLFLLYFVLAAILCPSYSGLLMAQESEEDSEPHTILLEPVADINPVKTHHTVVATVLDRQNRPLSGQRVEWILSRGGVGDIVEHDDMGAIIGSGKRITKIDNQYTVSYTNERSVLAYDGNR